MTTGRLVLASICGSLSSEILVAFLPSPFINSKVLTNRSLLGLLGTVFTPRIRPIGHTTQIQCAPHQLVPHTGTILRTPAPDQDHTVLLDVVALAGDVCCDGLSCGQAHTCRFPLTRVGFLGFRDADFDADAFALGVVALGESG